MTNIFFIIIKKWNFPNPHRVITPPLLPVLISLVNDSSIAIKDLFVSSTLTPADLDIAYVAVHMWCRTAAANSGGRWLAGSISIDPPDSSISSFPSTQQTTSLYLRQRGGARRCSMRRRARSGVWQRRGAARRAQTTTRSSIAPWRRWPCKATSHQVSFLFLLVYV